MIPRRKTGAGTLSRGSSPGRVRELRTSCSRCVPVGGAHPRADNRFPRRFLRAGAIFAGLVDPAPSLAGTPLTIFEALGVNPGGVERIFAADDFQKAGGLHEGLVSEAGDLLQLV